MHNNLWFWLIAASLLIIAEIAIPITFCLWLGISCAAIGLCIFFVPNLTLANQLIIFAVLSITSILLTRRYRKKLSARNVSHKNLNQRTQQWVGHTLVLKNDIKNGKGRERFGDSNWSIQGHDLKAGTKVKVVNFEGNILIVESVK